MEYEDPPLVSHDDADRVLSAALRGEKAEPEANTVLVGLALYDDDRTFVEEWCVRIAERAPDHSLRGLACLCIGSHLARRFGVVSDRAAALVREMANDSEILTVNGQVRDALDDLNVFLEAHR